MMLPPLTSASTVRWGLDAGLDGRGGDGGGGGGRGGGEGGFVGI